MLYQLDTTPPEPVVSLTTAALSPATVITVLVEFEEPVTGFSNATLTADREWRFISLASDDSRVFAVKVRLVDGDGDHGFQVAAGSVVDVAGE